MPTKTSTTDGPPVAVADPFGATDPVVLGANPLVRIEQPAGGRGAGSTTPASGRRAERRHGHDAGRRGPAARGSGRT
jgi:hypothetical protein